jgi:hypothetical protein
LVVLSARVRIIRPQWSIHRKFLSDRRLRH